MATSKDVPFIVEKLEELYPDTKTFLNYRTDYELLFATMLSAQATDRSVNEATKKLFALCPGLRDYKEANRDKILSCIRPVGLANSKCNYLIETAKTLLEKYDGRVPKDREALISLPGVGYKTSGVVLAELYDYPYIPVDTHVYRVTHRLGLVPSTYTPEKTETALEKKFQGYHSIAIHRQFILLGRNLCLARNEKCDLCPFISICSYYHKKGKQAK